MNLYKKKLFITLFLLLLIAVVFWTGSRYPQLNTKAMMGADTPSMGISFDVVKQVTENDSLVEKVVYNTLNWLDTNKKGMSFGFLFGAAFILLFSIVKDLRIKNRFLNTALGAIIGAPLGVCVNCAAPIAKGMKDAGAKTETALATMISSPTLNIIVLSMMFSFLPSYIVWLKIGFTLLFIFLVIPLISKLFREKEKKAVLEAPKPIKVPVFNLEVDESDKLITATWWSAFVWTMKSYWKSLFFIVKTTLPLMILAGLLGNLMITFFPLEDLVGLVDGLSKFEIIIYMLGIAIFASLLPVPIAFDVIITAILWSSGLHTRYATIILFCLGTYSIYSAFIVAKSFSFRLAIILFFVTVSFGFSAGVFGHYLETEMGINYRLENYESFYKSGSTPHYITGNDQVNSGLRHKELLQLLKKEKEKKEIYSKDLIQVFMSNYTERTNSKNNKFREIDGSEVGVKVPYQFSLKENLDPFANQRSIATGDVHNDGFADLLIVSAEDLFLFANIDGKKFRRQHLTTLKSKSVFNAALVDFNNDGWLDIFISTYRNGNYILKNDAGSFNENTLVKLPQLEKMILTVAPAFSDIDEDGLIDIILGNFSLGFLGGNTRSMKESRNYWLKNKGNFEFDIASTIKGADGETLSVLIADITDDGKSDMIVGNDFNVPDSYYVGQNNQKIPQLIEKPSQFVEKSTFTTMSIASVDVNNDLISEIFQVQIGRGAGENQTRDVDLICGGIQNEEERIKCKEVVTMIGNLFSSNVTKNFETCPDAYRNDCIALQLMMANIVRKKVNKPDSYFPKDWEYYKFILDLAEQDYSTPYFRSKLGSYEVQKGGVFLMKDSSGVFKDHTKEYNLSYVGWGWNSRFGDVDNDEWQDVLIANGYMINPTQASNIFYKNIEGKTFENKTDEAGFKNYLPTSSYSYLDYDLDGDLDVILVPSLGPIYIYENNYHHNNSIAFTIEDSKGNRNGVGAIVTIYYGDGKHQKREIKLSGGYKSYDETKVYFGLGIHDTIEKVVIDWTVGPQTIIKKHLSAGAIYEVRRN
jgi:uncharacterized membrane protein YraQ (UPF0718 family)